ncbi:YihY/virulence factor BrkB family protein [Bacteriovorax sp. Seq25_V]|uniref:YihY/virulence factor BrkB family protein n=1 Tax=Bacteriovorax sp. Seq25_V TaxID=1201288 RepID=UPI00038A401D|nr:YhjD/YihY/BrkB family envelope integrity protein [Bacteriovorax sp. Seq25_V]EQC45325.1 virulence factor BrkB [Bacteriovorax sp. Seq25_V]
MKLKNRFRSFLQFLILLAKDCDRSHLGILAASSSFYLILTFVPLVLVLTRILGFFFGPEGEKFDLLMVYVFELIPPHLDGVVNIIADMLKKSLFANKGFNIINTFFLLISSLGFINSIWKALSVITGEKNASQVVKTIKGIGVLAITCGFLTLAFIIPIVFQLITKISEVGYIAKMIAFFKIEKIFEILNSLIIGADIVSVIMIVIFMMSILRYILHPRINFKSALLGSGVFTILIISVKSLFFFYVSFVEAGLVANYGASYALILLFIWILFSMFVFYFSVLLSLNFHKYYYKKV